MESSTPTDLAPEVEALIAEGRESDRTQLEAIVALQRRRLKRDLVEGAGLLLLTDFWFLSGAAEALAVAAAGALAGLTWGRLGCGSVGVGIIAGATQTLLCFTLLADNSGSTAALLFGSAFAALAGSYLGMQRELGIRR